jgi:hypothetical protein
MKRAAAIAAVALLPPLAGCVAAALPLAAGAALGTRHVALAKRAAPAQATGSAAAAADLRVISTTLTALPPPTSPAGAAASPIAAFRSYALAQAQPVASAANQVSAILPTASSLRLERAPCGRLSPAVIVDLDPGKAAFDPLDPGAANVQLAAALADLRAAGITIVWVSRLGVGFEAAARAALQDRGLDPHRVDEVLLLTDLGERKQSQRDRVAKQHCVIALLGDERADFDELFLYLKQPDHAVALDAMLGNGWFLASPFIDPMREPAQDEAGVIAASTSPADPRSNTGQDR